jgi:hypothetical protein
MERWGSNMVTLCSVLSDTHLGRAREVHETDAGS